MFNGIVGATRQPRERETQQYEECPSVNGEFEQRESKEVVGRLERGIVSSKHMGMDGLFYTGALMVERAVMKLMSDYTKFMVLALQLDDVYRTSILGFARKKALTGELRSGASNSCVNIMFFVAGFRPIAVKLSRRRFLHLRLLRAFFVLYYR